MTTPKTMRWNALTVLLLATSMGCANTGEGMKQDSEIAADRTAAATEDAGDAMGGALMTGRVKSAIVGDSRIRSRDINVDTDDASKTVTIKGSVMTEQEKTMAGEVATSKATGYTIVNQLVIAP